MQSDPRPVFGGLGCVDVGTMEDKIKESRLSFERFGCQLPFPFEVTENANQLAK
jgi:hypothetical protein